VNADAHRQILHIIFMVSWFAGLFYLPRFFVYHSLATDPISIGASSRWSAVCTGAS
jgi:uncharacterized membrane protein